MTIIASNEILTFPSEAACGVELFRIRDVFLNAYEKKKRKKKKVFS
jgi:hypothetical protein